jgi:hypothetical protein
VPLLNPKLFSYSDFPQRIRRHFRRGPLRQNPQTPGTRGPNPAPQAGCPRPEASLGGSSLVVPRRLLYPARAPPYPQARRSAPGENGRPAREQRTAHQVKRRI